MAEVERDEDVGAGSEGLTGAERGVDIAEVVGVSRAEVRTRLARRVVRNASVTNFGQNLVRAQAIPIDLKNDNGHSRK